MSKTDNELPTFSFAANLSSTGPVSVTVPYNSSTGRVYLNACGQDQTEVMHALTAIELTEEEFDAIRVVEAQIDFSDGAKLLSNLFPVVVPIHIETGRPILLGLGSNLREAEANLAFANGDADEHMLVFATMRMPAPSLQNGEPLRRLPSPGS